MKRLILILLACLCLLTIGAKPYRGPMRVTSECREMCGIDCAPCDECIGGDERWGFTVEGALNPGESYTYEPPYTMCHTMSEIDAAAYAMKGKGDLLVRLDVWEEGYHWVSESDSSVCMIVPTGNITEQAKWSVTITNIGKRTIRNVYLHGVANGMTFADATCDDAWGHSQCPVQQSCP